MDKSVTLVSCLYNLARTKWHHSGFPPNYDRYESWSENFLSLDANIVIFCDEYYLPKINEKRRKYDPDFKKTVVVLKKIHELEIYQKYFVKMAVLMSSPQFKRIKHADCADNMYPLYNVVQYSKLSFLNQVAESNPFGATHIMWMDAGSCREGLAHYKNRPFPLNQSLLFDNKITHFTHNRRFNIHRRQDYFLSQIRNIQGTSFIVPKILVPIYRELIQRELQSSMDEGFIGSDEKVYDSIYVQNKDMIELVKCGWFKFYDVMRQTPEEFEAQQIVEATGNLPNGGRRIFVDCGTNDCGRLSHYVNHYNMDHSWEIHCFEAHPKMTCDCLPVEDHKITLHKKAVWKHNGSVLFKMYGPEGMSSGSLVGETGGGQHYHDFYEDAQVESVDFYEFLSQFKKDDHIYIKMDIEHSEYDVLEHLIEKGWPENIKELYVEWHALDDRNYHQNFAERKERIVNHLAKTKTTLHDIF